MKAETGSWEVVGSQILPNYIHVDLVVRGNPADADVAVCSTDESGRPGALNRLRLEGLGLPAEKLASVFHPPATVLTETSRPVLVVQTVGHGKNSREHLSAGFAAGLEQLRKVDHHRIPRVPSSDGLTP